MEEEIQDQTQSKIKLDYTLKTPEERTEYIRKLVAELPQEKLTNHILESFSDYIINAIPKQEKQEKMILTDNRLITVNKRETSYEGLCDKLENGEDGIQNMLSDLGKNTILSPKDPITAEDVAQNPELQSLIDNIKKVEEEYARATGRKKYLLKKQIIEMRQEQYTIRNRIQSIGQSTKVQPSFNSYKINLEDHITFDENGEPVNGGLVSFFNPKHITAILCNYNDLKISSKGNFNSDIWYMMEDFDKLLAAALAEYPQYKSIIEWKVADKTNLEIQELLKKEYNINHTVEYISCLWRNKIPKLIAEQASLNYLEWYYTNVEKGKWKRCSRCGEIKLAHNRFFSKNKSSKDGFYSICKDCRNKKSKEI